MTNSDKSSDSYGAMRELSHERNYGLWQAAKQGATFEGEDARLVEAMRDHPEYYDTWEHLTEFGREQVVINGVNPLLHVMMHSRRKSSRAERSAGGARDHRIQNVEPHSTPRDHPCDCECAYGIDVEIIIQKQSI